MQYWIWSNEHGAWWAADRRGYVRNLAAAGRYSAGDAARIVEGANLAQMDRPGLERHEVAIPVEAVDPVALMRAESHRQEEMGGSWAALATAADWLEWKLAGGLIDAAPI